MRVPVVVVLDISLIEWDEKVGIVPGSTLAADVQATAERVLRDYFRPVLHAAPTTD